MIERRSLQPFSAVADRMEPPLKILRDTREFSSTPFLSMVVPCYQVEAVVLDTLKSLWQAGTFPALECLIIDDGSSDGTLNRVISWFDQNPRPGVLIVSQRNQGLSAVRNQGASWARGEWLAFLDSDDLVTAAGFSAFWAIAEQTPADLLLGAVRIIEGERSEVHKPFYHETLWQTLLGSQAMRLTSIRCSPALFGLEPNVNYRWIRRRFYLEAALQFPEGLLFEDIPVHFRMLRLARQIALISTPYYLYRIHRPGKITESSDLRRLDALKTMAMGLDELTQNPLTVVQGSFATRSLLRLAWGCGRMMPTADRLAYFRALSIMLARIPWRWRLLSLFLAPRQKPLLGILMVLRAPRILMAASRVRASFGRARRA